LPVVITSTPASKIFLAVFSVIPIPPAEFSPFAITRSGEWRSRNWGIAWARPSRPARPQMSPMKRTFTGGA
jgi:hypothetical protein